VIETVVSDLGNVLLRFDNSVFYRAIARFSCRPEKEIEAVVADNLDLLVLFEKGVLSPYDFYRNSRDLLEWTGGYEEFFAAYCEGVFTPVPAVLGLFRKLKSRYRTVLLSNTDVIRWTHVKTKFPDLLIFDEYILSFDVGFRKPQLEIYLEAIRAGGAAPGRTAFIDDLPDNVAGAERAGMKGILCSPGENLEPKLRDLGLIF
jgi:FMN phosphatase YigB (HAD superfamily)